jgi:hypothetical protein
MGHIKKLFYLFVFISEIFITFGCGAKNPETSVLNGEWTAQKYSIAYMSAWSDDDAKKMLGGILTVENDYLEFVHDNKKCRCEFGGIKVSDTELKNVMNFNPKENDTFNIDSWDIQKEQEVMKIDLNSTSCPFVVLLYLKTDKKIILLGDGGAFLMLKNDK